MDDHSGSRRSRSGRPDPADLRQLADSPVSLRRIARLFAPHRATLAVVIALIVLSSPSGSPSRSSCATSSTRRSRARTYACCSSSSAPCSASPSRPPSSASCRPGSPPPSGQRVMHRLRSDLFAHLQRQSLGFFTRTRGGEVQSRLVNDIGSMQGVVTQTATSIAANLTVVVGTAVAMVALSWRLALLSLVVLPPAVLLTRQVARMRHQVTAERQRRLADLHVQIEEGLSVSGVLLTKTLGAVAAPDRAVRGDLRRPGRPRDPVPARRPLADGHDEHRLRRRPRRDLPRRRPPRHLGRDDHRHARRLHRPPGQPVPAADGPAQRRRRHHRPRWRCSAGSSSTPTCPSRSPSPRDPARARRAPARRRGPVRGRRLRVRRRPAGAAPTSTCIVPAGSTLALVGETGSGKSTLASLVPRLHDVDVGPGHHRRRRRARPGRRPTSPTSSAWSPRRPT